MMNPYRVITALLLLSQAALLLSLFLGSTPLPLHRIFTALLLQGEAGDQIVIWDIRLPRAVTAYLVGAALGASGAALQGLFRNPLADPGVLGVSAMASLAATIAIYYELTLLSSWILPLAAISGAIVATSILVIANRYADSVINLLLVGVAMSSFAAACMSLLLNLAPNPFSLSDMLNWSLGSVANRSLPDIAFSLPFIAIGAMCLYRSKHGLGILSLGEEAAAGLGLRSDRHRTLVVTGASIATGAAVALAGAIGFVGLIAPHIIRPFVDHNPARLLLPSAMLGGTLLVLADIGVRVIPSTNELNLGVVAALVGAPIFAWIVISRRGSYV